MKEAWRIDYNGLKNSKNLIKKTKEWFIQNNATLLSNASQLAAKLTSHINVYRDEDDISMYENEFQHLQSIDQWGLKMSMDDVRLLEVGAGSGGEVETVTYVISMHHVAPQLYLMPGKRYLYVKWGVQTKRCMFVYLSSNFRPRLICGHATPYWSKPFSMGTDSSKGGINFMLSKVTRGPSSSENSEKSLRLPSVGSK
jgi:hypothetical protein